MASINSNTNSSRKRNISFSHFLATQNLSIFRSKSPIIDCSIQISDPSEFNKTQLNSKTEQPSIPLCINRSWLKNRLPRPLSLDLDPVNNHEYLTEQQSSKKQTEKKQIFPRWNISSSTNNINSRTKFIMGRPFTSPSSFNLRKKQFTHIHYGMC
ncbi:unnamed protein product [Adineta steineri]|uniref:Uncharacterized protein n=1 Tax=Adineta steineri TaxID=433720 RepID=A0A813TET7_9BILA|nr:unnamed protein product [Adineta steineri]CAF3734870.1 unnamed protein product [Adineta steineri]